MYAPWRNGVFVGAFGMVVVVVVVGAAGEKGSSELPAKEGSSELPAKERSSGV